MAMVASSSVNEDGREIASVVIVAERHLEGSAKAVFWILSSVHGLLRLGC